MADDHCGGHVVTTRVGVYHNAGIALELVNGPALRHELLEIRLQHPVGHGGFQTNGTWSSQHLTHELELRRRH